jgi:glycosyltransferase involved in cell wall biosynthesis
MHKFLNKGRAIITLSEFSKSEIIARYQIDEGKIHVVRPAAKEIFHPSHDDANQLLKARLTDAKEYFAYTGSIDNGAELTNLLKAFSIFKKRQASNLKFVIASASGEINKGFVASLANYKYRDDVVLVTQASVSQLADITGAAYAMVNPFTRKDSTLAVLETIRCHVPMIASTGSAVAEVAGDAALYVDPLDHGELAEKMMALYKDENLRARLINKEISLAGQYSYQQTASAFWDVMMGALQ